LNAINAFWLEFRLDFNLIFSWIFHLKNHHHLFSHTQQGCEIIGYGLPDLTAIRRGSDAVKKHKALNAPSRKTVMKGHSVCKHIFDFLILSVNFYKNCTNIFCSKIGFWLWTFVKQIFKIVKKKNQKSRAFSWFLRKKTLKNDRVFWAKLQFFVVPPKFEQINIIQQKNLVEKGLNQQKMQNMLIFEHMVAVDYRRKNRIFTWPLWSPETTKSGFFFSKALM
jgi:hypothetical protein